MSSIATKPEPVTKLDILDDALIYGSFAGLAQVVSHKIIARDQLPRTWEELITRYAAGSSIIALGISAYAMRRPGATARDAALLHWGVLLWCGAVVGACHLYDHLSEQGAIEALRRQFIREEHGQFPPAVLSRHAAARG